MKLKKRVFVFAVLLVCGGAGAQVFRCEAGGKVTYTDGKCQGATVRSVDVQGYPPSAPSSVRPPPRAEPLTPIEVSARPVLPPGSCPSETDIKNIHTRLSASVVAARNRAALYIELAKAEGCPSGGRPYRYEEWKRLEAVLRGDD